MLDIKEDLSAYLGGKEDPCKLHRIMKDLGFRQDDRQYVKSALAEMVREGRVVRRDNRFWVPEGKKVALRIKREKRQKKHEIVGRLSLTSRGTGFVSVPDGEDWLIPGHAQKGAKHGDIVRAIREGLARNGRISAEIVAIEEFGKSKILGVFEKSAGKISFLPFGNDKLDRSELIGFPEDVADGAVGRWQRQLNGQWLFDGILGQLEDPRIDEIIALAENDIEPEFPSDVLEETASFPEDYSFSPEGRRDFRDKLIFTVDGADARDFDDALHISPLGHGEVEVGIHIADVSSFVSEGSLPDRQARNRGNSVYLPHKAFPMLPPILSNHLCSLKPGVPRYTLSVVARLQENGKLLSFSVCKGLIISRYRLTYDDVAEVGITRDEAARNRLSEVADAIDLGLKLARRMRQRRIKDGGLDFDLAEVRLTLDAEHRLAQVRLARQNDAHRLIEAFMCLANECIAEHLVEMGIPFRIHDPPDPDELERLAFFLKSFGFSVPSDLARNTGPAMNRILACLHEQPAGQVLQLQLLKTLKLAEYHVDNRGHFGLSSSFYAHFTSPIRRYADLLVHRRLTRLLEETDLGPEYFDDRTLSEVCAHISKKERDAARAEQLFVRLKLLRHMAQEVGSTFSGTIVETRPHGFFVRLDDWYASGLVLLASLRDDYYEFIPDILALVGKRTGKQFKVGLPVKVQVVRVDLIERKMDLELVEGGCAPAGEDTSPRTRSRDRPSHTRGRRQVRRFLGRRGRGKGGKKRR